MITTIENTAQAEDRELEVGDSSSEIINHNSEIINSPPSSALNSQPATLPLFTDPSLLAEIGHIRLPLFLKPFAADLAAVGIDLPEPPSPDDVHDRNPAPESTHGIYFRSMAALFAESHLLPDRLLKTCRALELAAAPEGFDRFEDIQRRRLPNISLSTSPLDRVLEMCFVCPDELSAFMPAPELNAQTAKVAEHRREDSDVKQVGTTSTSSQNSVKKEKEICMGTTWKSSLPLLDSLAALLPRYVVLPKHAAETLALWIVHTYCFQFRDVSTYIGVESPEKRCGKTTLLGVLSKLVHRPVVASNISPSAFFRVIEEMQPTLLIDEADTFLQANDELRGILNAGYHKPGAYVIRVSNEPASRPHKKVGTTSTSSQNFDRTEKELHTGTTWKSSLPFSISNPPSSPQASDPSSISHLPSSTSLATYSTWCPKFIAAIGHLPETLADRCIVIRMQRKRDGEVCLRLRDLDAELSTLNIGQTGSVQLSTSSCLRDLDSELINAKSELINSGSAPGIINHKSEIINSCIRFAAENQAAIAAAKPEVPKPLNDRAADIWEPLFVIADLAGGDWPEKARAAAIALTTGAQESSASGSLLFDLAYLFKFIFKKDRVFTEDIVIALTCDHFADRPWREARNGKPINEIWLSRQLKPYGVRPKSVRMDDKVRKGYDIADLQQTFRYIPRVEIENFKAEITGTDTSDTDEKS